MGGREGGREREKVVGGREGSGSGREGSWSGREGEREER